MVGVWGLLGRHVVRRSLNNRQVGAWRYRDVYALVGILVEDASSDGLLLGERKSKSGRIYRDQRGRGSDGGRRSVKAFGCLHREGAKRHQANGFMITQENMNDVTRALGPWKASKSLARRSRVGTYATPRARMCRCIAWPPPG